MSHARAALAAAAALCVVLALAAAPALATKVPTGPAGRAFYSPPASKLPGPHGSVIWARPIHGGALPRGGQSWLVLYRSQAPSGKTVATSGVVTIPSRQAPAGGYPVVSWAHGTTGIADSCAPSLAIATPQALDYTYTKDLRAEQTEWVREGFAVAQTDYQGLGTAGMHPYLIGVSEGRSVVDAALAARALSPHVGHRWVAIGHSQGGHATLWAAALGPHYAPTMKLEGALPLAPASHIRTQAQALSQIDSNSFGGLPALIAAHIDYRTALSDRAIALYPQIEQVCLGKLGAQDSWGGLPLDQIFRDGYDTTPVLDEVGRNDPENLTIRVPLLIAQGKADTTVFPNFTDDTVQSLESRGTKITYDTYDGINHTEVVQASRKDADAFIDRLLGAG
jgi:pimeloyl-ACP methyl ester carboxylesterase